VTRLFLHIIFRNPDGSLTVYSRYLALVALFMIASGIWSLLSPHSYVRFTTQGRWVKPPSGPFWTIMSQPRSVRIVGTVAILVAVGFMGWVVFVYAPGRLY
jgi:hypothetical protein